MMRSIARHALVCLALGTVGLGSRAALSVGASAPDFSAQAAQAGKAYTFHLAQALKQGPVVLFFYPKAFTSGCTAQAHLFASAVPRFKELGATVVGVSGDDLEMQKKFSVSECRGQFGVVADAGSKIIQAYDAGMWFKPSLADRITYVITPDGKVAHVYGALSPDEHVNEALSALRAWKAAQSR